MVITRIMIDVFQILSHVCHNDATSVSVYENADHNKTDSGVRISFGHSKKHRKDSKQLIWSMSVSCDHAFPLFQPAYSGNTADVTTYVEQWHKLIDLLDCHDFLYVADSKVITHENMAHIADNEGFCIAPAPMYESYKNQRNVFFEQLDTELHNLYGPTEAAVDVTHRQCRRQNEQPIIPIGYPVANTQIYILDAHLQPVPIGVTGELHIGGIQVARGCLNRPELTAGKFIPDPFSEDPQARLYKTGDLACFLPDGKALVRFLPQL